jgi:hypothetical protein
MRTLGITREDTLNGSIATSPRDHTCLVTTEQACPQTRQSLGAIKSRQAGSIPRSKDGVGTHIQLSAGLLHHRVCCWQRPITASLERSDPKPAQTLYAERMRLIPLLERRKAVLCRDRTTAPLLSPMP